MGARLPRSESRDIAHPVQISVVQENVHYILHVPMSAPCPTHPGASTGGVAWLERPFSPLAISGTLWRGRAECERTTHGFRAGLSLHLYSCNMPNAPQSPVRLAL